MAESLRELGIHLAERYAAALALPDVCGDDDDATAVFDDDVVEAPAWSSPGMDTYWEVFDPLQLSEPVAGSLDDDVRDIYCDLYRGLRLYDDPDVSWKSAVWEWRFHFERHWGDHAVDALRALQRAIHG